MKNFWPIVALAIFLVGSIVPIWVAIIKIRKLPQEEAIKKILKYFLILMTWVVYVWSCTYIMNLF